MHHRCNYLLSFEAVIVIVMAKSIRAHYLTRSTPKKKEKTTS